MNRRSVERCTAEITVGKLASLKNRLSALQLSKVQIFQCHVGKALGTNGLVAQACCRQNILKVLFRLFCFHVVSFLT